MDGYQMLSGAEQGNRNGCDKESDTTYEWQMRGMSVAPSLALLPPDAMRFESS